MGSILTEEINGDVIHHIVNVIKKEEEISYPLALKALYLLNLAINHNHSDGYVNRLYQLPEDTMVNCNNVHFETYLSIACIKY